MNRFICFITKGWCVKSIIYTITSNNSTKYFKSFTYIISFNAKWRYQEKWISILWKITQLLNVRARVYYIDLSKEGIVVAGEGQIDGGCGHGQRQVPGAVPLVAAPVLQMGHHEELALPKVSRINQEALLLTAKAMELFVQYLTTYSYRHGSGKEKKALLMFYQILQRNQKLSSFLQTYY